MKSRTTGKIPKTKSLATHSLKPAADNSIYKILFENIEDYCIFTTDREGMITTWNKAAEEITGFREREILGKNAKILFIPEDCNAGVQAKELRKAKREGRFESELCLLRKDSKKRWVSSMVLPLKDPSGKWTGFTKIIRDLSERRNYQLKLNESESLSASIFDSSSECVKILDLKGNLLRMSKPGQQTMEIEDFKEYEGRCWLDFWQDDHLKAAKSALRQAKNGGSGTFRGFTPTAKGNPKWWEVTLTPIRTTDDTITKLLCVSRDITGVKHQEDKMQNLVHELEMEKNKLIDVFEKAPAFLAILSGEEHVFELANKAYYQTVGNRNIMGKSIEEALPELKDQGFIEILDRVYLTGKAFIGNEMRAMFQRKPDGPPEERYLNVVFKAAKNSRGKITGLYANGYDITEEVLTRKKVEESEAALQQSEESLRQLADSMPQMVWTAKPNGYLDYYNKQWYEYTGFKQGESGDESWKPILHPEDLQYCLDTWRNAVANGIHYEIEYRFKDRKNPGEYRWFLGRALPIKDNDGNIIKWIGTCTDIQEQKQLQRQKDDFLAIASHELKTPVTSIKAYGQVLENLLRSKGDEASADMLKRMDSQINKLTNLIGDLLDVTKIQSGKLQLNETEFDFNDMVTEVVADLQRTSVNHQLVIKPGKIPKVYADRDRLGQVLINFITNAIKYSPNADKIFIKTKKSGKNAELCVEDFGIGIPADKKNEVFGQFYRISGDKRITYPGLGLGLYISSEIIKREGGRIWVESEEGKGSLFCFEIPIRKHKP